MRRNSPLGAGSGPRPKIVKALPCFLTMSEVDDYARQQSALYADFNVQEEEAKAQAARAKTRLKTLRAEMDRLAECVTTGMEKRNVDCFWQFNRAEGIASLIREDTGEVVTTREMTSDEMQVSASMEYAGVAMAGAAMGDDA